MASKPKSTVLLAVSSLALGTLLIGCTPTGRETVNPLARASTALDKASREAADAAMIALGKGDVDEAVALAERAVGFSPRDAGYRSLLSNAYIRAGRFTSAEASFRETLLLNPSDGRASLSLALARIALGDRQGARATLDEAGSQIAAADRGLALALTGDPQAALTVLEPAARDLGATARVRQNLALAYALAGQWEQARVVAAQDVPADELPARMASWAEFARPDGEAGQVPSLLGVARAADPGRPERLALIVDPAPVAVAQAEQAPTPLAITNIDAPVPAVAETAPIEAAPVEVAAAPVATPEPVAVAAVSATPVAALPVLAAAPVVSAVPNIPAVRRAPKPRAMNGRYAVQLGAFSNKARVEQAWTQVLRRHRSLGRFLPSSTSVSSRSGLLHRLSVSGFGTQRQAVQMCAEVRRQGGACFVRTVAGDQPIRWASRQTRNG